jgi:hypothetical protein
MTPRLGIKKGAVGPFENEVTSGGSHGGKHNFDAPRTDIRIHHIA